MNVKLKCAECGAKGYPVARLNPTNWHEERAMLCAKCAKRGGFKRSSRISMGIGAYDPEE